MSDNEEESVLYDQKIKIMILGETLVGKTALLTRYTKNIFGGAYLTTVGIDFQYKFLNIRNMGHGWSSKIQEYCKKLFSIK